MSVSYFLHILLKRWKWLLVLPLIAAFSVFFLSKKKPKGYTSSMSLYTGMLSGVSIDENSAYSQAAMAYENFINIVKSDRTFEDVGLRLFANVLVYQDKNEEYITTQSYQKLRSLIPSEVSRLIVKGSVDKTFENLKHFMHKGDDNFVYGLIYKSSTNFSKGALSRVEVKRIKNSDIVQLSYSTDDPALCYQSLKLICSYAIKNYKSLRMAQSSGVVKYFEQQLDSSSTNLNRLENDLVEYNRQNKIINFPEQTKQVVTQKLNVEQQLDQLQMTAQAATGVIAQMEAKMGLKNRLRLKSAQVLYYRDQIGLLAAENAMKVSLLNDSTAINIVNHQYNNNLSRLRKEFFSSLDTISFVNNTADGVSIENIVAQWLDNVIRLEQTKAQMPVLAKRTQIIDGMYDIYAPMGAIVKRKERAIDVTEKKYLSHLESLNSAKMKEQNEEFKANSIRLLDEPNYPFSALPNKSMLMAMIAGLATFILVLTFIVLTEYFDRTLSTPQRSERQIGAKPRFLFPVMNKTNNENLEEVYRTAIRYFVMDVLRQAEAMPFTLNLFSVYQSEGKSFIYQVLVEEFNKMGNELSSQSINMIKVVEYPAIKENYIASELITATDMNILICRANRAWKRVDSKLLKDLSLNLGKSPYVLLNGVSIDVFESSYGELPLKRGFVREFFKRIVNLEFTSRSRF